MKNKLLYRAGYSEAIRWACRFLAEKGVAMTDTPNAHVTHLLLPVPSFEHDGRIRGGGILEHILADLPTNITVIGGNLNHPALCGYKTMDLLRDGLYAAQNGSITADCAIRVAGNHLSRVFAGCPILIIGWGRIGKALAAQLKAMGAAVTVAARKESDRQMLLALGYGAENTATLGSGLARYRVIFNTAPAPILEETQTRCVPECIKIELASQPGIEGPDVIKALGLPGKMAPESAGKLIADTIARLLESEERI